MNDDFKVQIVRINDVVEHPNADRLEIAQVLGGWQCIIQKGAYRKGDIAIYIPVDSILPEGLETRIFGPDSKVKLNKHRVRTIKLRGSISQGMLIPTSFINSPVSIGLDVTKELMIRKYEPPVPQFQQRGMKSASNRQTNTNFKRYAKWPNIRNVINLFRLDEQVVITEKMHGTNFRAGWVRYQPRNWFDKIKKFLRLTPDYEFVYGSHNVQLSNKSMDNVYGRIVEKYDLRNRLPQGVVVYGEICGAGIQKGYFYGSDEHFLILFDIEREGLMQGQHVSSTFAMMNNFQFVPELYRGPWEDVTLSDYYTGPSVFDPATKVREGCVVRSSDGLRGAKVINPEYLLGKDNTDFH